MSGTHGTNTTAGPTQAPTPPEVTEATGETGARPETLDAVTRLARRLLPADGVITDHARLRTYECDGLAHYKVTPALVVMPETTEQLAAVVRACAEHLVPFVARGSGTGLSGGALPRADGVLVVTSRMRTIRQVRREDQRAVVEPGVINLDVTRAAAPHGYYYAPDPSSQQICSIGGNVAENSGGAHCLKYGFTTNHVLGAEFVTPGGDIVELGGMAPDAPGYDLLGAVVGSEGTLGVVTSVIVRLVRAPEAVRTILAGFESTDDAGAATSAIIAAGIVPAAIEMMDALAIEAAEAAVHCNYPPGAGAVLVIELDGAAVEVEHEFGEVDRLCHEHHAFEMRVATDPTDRALIWQGRKSAFAAVGRISPDYIVQDGVIPRTSLPEVLRAIAELSSSSGVRVANVFHAGDGNLHPLVLFDDSVAGAGVAAEKVSGAILDLCIGHGGSITGEHGVGIDKSAYMPRMFNEEDLDTMQLVRCAFDPDTISNPGKIFPTPRLCGEVPGRHKGAHPLQDAGLGEVF
jgi:glycolate oxidase